jgi:hypothetical protein
VSIRVVGDRDDRNPEHTVHRIESSRSMQDPLDVRRDPRSLRSHREIQQHLALLIRQENRLSLALNEALGNRSQLDKSIHRLAALVPRVKHLTQQVDGDTEIPDLAPGSNTLLRNDETDRQALPVFDEASDDESNRDDLGLVERVRSVWVTSERVGGKVRKLDVEVSRVKEASERVQEVLELRVSRTFLVVIYTCS